MGIMVKKEHIERLAREAGFDLCGVARVRQLGEWREPFAGWLQKGYHSQMEYMTRHFDKRFDPSQLMAGATTVIVCAVSYKTDASLREFTPGERLISSYALAKDYHLTIKTMLGQMLEKLREIYPEVGGRTFCDTAPILEKAWAVEAGIGWQGKNGLLINPKFGSFILLGELVIDYTVDEYSQPFAENHCGSCMECMERCPNGAIVAPRVIDTNLCISRLSIEKTESPASAEQLHGWIFGCDICQRVCPWNVRAQHGSNPEFQPVIDPSQLTSEFWHGLTRERFDEIFAATPLSRRGFDEIKRRL